ncbi:MAG: chemotaxis-specific protein-glutamate methyltransferase CheB [Chthoniobacteraceae bacterium]
MPPLPSPRKRVLIVEDSLVIREFLSALIGSDPRLEVVGAVASGEEALRTLHKTRPDVITMDIRLPGMSGLETTKRIMSERPTPIIVVAASVQSEDLNISMNALRAGALGVIEKPVGFRHQDYAAVAEKLCTQLYLMSEVRCIRQTQSRELSPPLTAPRAAASATPSAPRPAAHTLTYRMIGIVASTGGPNAVVKVLTALGPGFPLPIALVQHITASFLPGFVSWLEDTCPQKVVVAEQGQTLQPGHVYVAPADRHLTITSDLAVRLTDGPLVSVQRPSGTVLFESMARALGRHSLGVLLTGMGDDGARGLAALYDAGAFTIAEAESTAVVYGMPAAAVKLGAVSEILPVDLIGERLVALSGRSNSAA